MIVTQRSKRDEQDERDEDSLLCGPGEAARPGRPGDRIDGLDAHALLPLCCDQTAPAMIAPLTTSAAASGTPLARRV